MALDEYYPLKIKGKFLKEPIPKGCEEVQLIIKKAYQTFKQSKNIKINDGLNGIFKKLDEIIPVDYFGKFKNKKLFYKIVKKILTQSHKQCIYTEEIILNYDIKTIPWLKNTEETVGKELLLKYNMYLLEYLVKPLINHYFKPLRTFNANEIKFLPRNEWFSFYNKILNQLLKKGHLSFNESYSKIKPKGYLLFVPKDIKNLKYRVLFNNYNKPKGIMKSKYQILNDKIYNACKQIGNYHNDDSYEMWKEYAMMENKGKLYGVKLDIKDAYGNVNLKKLSEIIMNTTTLSENDKIFLNEHINNQYVSISKMVWKWNHGLLQGDSLSGALYNLYATYQDHNIFKIFRDRKCFIYRSVDDYLLFSYNENDIQLFIESIKNLFVINESKTITNLNMDNVNIIPYCGLNIDLNTKEITRIFNIPKMIKQKFNFWNKHKPIISKKEFLLQSINFYNFTSYFSKYLLNTYFNSEDTVMLNYYQGMVYVAIKFEAAYMCVKNFITYDRNEIDWVVGMFVRKVHVIINTFKGPKYEGKIKYITLKVVAYRAFIVVLKIRNEAHKDVIKGIKRDIQNDCHILRKFKTNFYKYPENLPKIVFSDHIRDRIQE